MEGIEDEEDLLAPEELDDEGEEGVEIEGEETGKAGDPVALYLREIGSVPLLTREDEVELGKKEGRGGNAGYRASSLIFRCLALCPSARPEG